MKEFLLLSRGSYFDMAYKDLDKKRSSGKLRHYRASDKRDNLETDLTLDETRALLSQPCYWCAGRERIGIDRLVNSIGHVKTNCVASCVNCNFILGDLNFESKLELREGLRRIREKNLLGDWLPPPERKILKIEVSEVDSDEEFYEIARKIKNAD